MVEGPELPSLGDSGWKRKDTGGWEIHWTTLPEANRPVADSPAVDAKRGAEDSVNVSRQHFSPLPFATVMDCFQN